ncbi:archaeosine biosynthesis radical SAM protein RaSEA [Cuniculiplasma sp. SKW3]|uniref:archaeosine biosynthesis radical SAM protein RaSEA n=1 Tax=unclassified Cuniculiplasma TaxID=2619706 RepID=UPI003FD230ED
MINRDLAIQIKNLMPSRVRDTDQRSPVSMWNEMDRLRGKPENTAVVIFRTRGCAWYDFTSCSMCGYFNDVNSNVTPEDLMTQIDKLMEFLTDQKVLKVFTSGSFLDSREIPEKVFNYFVENVSKKIDKLLIESRTEFVTNSTMSKLRDSGIDTRIAIGVESTNDKIIRESINKGTTFKKFLDAASIVNKYDLELRSYLLLKPLFLNEEAAIRDAKKSVYDCAAVSDDISVNPMNIQKNTLVEKMWKKGLYRPPWLWSVARVLLETEDAEAEVLSYPTGANMERGAHNNKKDPELLKLIFEASLTQNFEKLGEYYENSDLTEYKAYMDVESSIPISYDIDSFIRKISSGSVSV